VLPWSELAFDCRAASGGTLGRRIGSYALARRLAGLFGAARCMGVNTQTPFAGPLDDRVFADESEIMPELGLLAGDQLLDQGNHGGLLGNAFAQLRDETAVAVHDIEDYGVSDHGGKFQRAFDFLPGARLGLGAEKRFGKVQENFRDLRLGERHSDLHSSTSPDRYFTCGAGCSLIVLRSCCSRRRGTVIGPSRLTPHASMFP